MTKRIQRYEKNNLATHLPADVIGDISTDAARYRKDPRTDATHPLIVSTYKYFGMIHSKLGNNDSALLYYGKALKGMKDNTQEADEIRKEMEFLK